jgi:hypothetical protein
MTHEVPSQQARDIIRMQEMIGGAFILQVVRAIAHYSIADVDGTTRIGSGPGSRPAWRIIWRHRVGEHHAGSCVWDRWPDRSTDQGRPQQRHKAGQVAARFTHALALFCNNAE